MNLAYIVIDTLRYDYIGANGNDWIETPNIDAFAANAWAFDNAFCASFPTIPYRTDVITGQYGAPFHPWKPLRHERLTLPWTLAEKGYATQLIHDTPHLAMADTTSTGLSTHGRSSEVRKWIGIGLPVALNGPTIGLSSRCLIPSTIMPRNPACCGVTPAPTATAKIQKIGIARSCLTPPHNSLRIMPIEKTFSCGWTASIRTNRGRAAGVHEKIRQAAWLRWPDRSSYTRRRQR